MLTIYRSEASASLRRVPMWFVLSNGTSPATAEAAGQPQINWMGRGTATVNTAATLSLVSANAGLYYVELSASEVSALGGFSVQYGSATAVANFTVGKIVNYDSGDSMRLGQFSLPNAAANATGGLPQKGTVHSDFTSRVDAVTYSGVTVQVNNIAPNVYSGVSVGIRDSGIAPTTFIAGNYSGVSVEVKTGGIQTNSVGSATYSGVTFGANPVGDKTGYGVSTIAAGVYSGVSVEVKAGGIQTTSYGLGNYSGVSFEVKTGGIQTTSIGKGAYSGVSLEVTTGGIQVVSIGKGAYSGVSVEITNIAPNSYSGVTVDGAKFLSTAGERSAASSLLSTSLGGTTPRLIQQAFELLRNRVQISGSTMTVYKTDDTTSSWTATTSTGTATIYGVQPGLA